MSFSFTRPGIFSYIKIPQGICSPGIVLKTSQWKSANWQRSHHSKLGIKLPYDPAIPLLGIYPEETIIEKDICTWMFIAAVFTTARTWKQPRCPLTDEWIKKLWYIHTMEYYSAIKRNAFESVLMRWTNLEPVAQSEVRERQISYINAYIWNLERQYWLSYLQVSKGDTDIKNRLSDMGKGVAQGRGKEEGGMIWESSTETYTLPYVKQIKSGSLMYDTGNPKPGLCDNLEGWDGEGGGREVQEGGELCIPMSDSEKAMAPHSSILAWRIPWMEEPGRLPSVGSHRVGHDWSDLAAAAAWLIHVDIWQKPTQYC